MRSLQLDEFRNYRFLSALQYAPGGKAAAFVVSKADMEENAYESSIYVYENGVFRRGSASSTARITSFRAPESRSTESGD